jgi:hypothetical protein
MSTGSRDDATHRLSLDGAFVVQFVAGTDLTAGPVGGRVEHVQSGRAAQFASLDELLHFVGTMLARTEPATS